MQFAVFLSIEICVHTIQEPPLNATWAALGELLSKSSEDSLSSIAAMETHCFQLKREQSLVVLPSSTRVPMRNIIGVLDELRST